MKTKWAMMADFSITMPDRPGELMTLSTKLRDSEINLYGLWGYGGVDSINGNSRFYCVPENAAAFREFIKRENIKFEEGLTIYLTGPDSGGALVETLELIASEGINLHAIQAVAIRGEYGCFIWADPQHWDKLSQILA